MTATSSFNPHAIPFLLYYFMACYLQTNDPDAKLWVPMYAVPVILVMWSVFQFSLLYRLRKIVAHSVAFSALIAAATANNFATWRRMLDDPRQFDSILANDEVCNRELSFGLWLPCSKGAVCDWQQTLREQLGLLVVAISLVWVCTSFRSPFVALFGACLFAAVLSSPNMVVYSPDGNCGTASSDSSVLFQNRKD
jgi:hypothetical protein